MSSQKKVILDEMAEMHDLILERLQRISDLNAESKDKQQKHFLKTFIHIIDKISNQLLVAQEKYKNIDKQIERDEKCIKLAGEVKFFREQCLQLRRQLAITKQKLTLQKQKNAVLRKEKQALNFSLFRKSRQAVKYRTKVMSFSKEIEPSEFVSQNKASFKNTFFKSNDEKMRTVDRPKQKQSQNFQSTEIKPVKFRDLQLQIVPPESKKYRNSLISTSHGFQSKNLRKKYI